MKAFRELLLCAVILCAAWSAALASDDNMACVDIVSDDGNISHIFVSAGAEASNYAITVNGEQVDHLSMDESPCADVTNDVWFALQSHQDTAYVCVSVQGSGPLDLRVSAKVNNECITGTTPLVSIERVS